ASEIDRGGRDALRNLESAIRSMISALNDAVGDFRKAGANMGQALADGLNSKAKTVEAAARRLANAAAAAVRAAAAIRSPSRVFIELGDQMAAGLAVGLDDGRDEVAKAGGRLVDTLADVNGRAQHEVRLYGSAAWRGSRTDWDNSELANMSLPRALAYAWLTGP